MHKNGVQKKHNRASTILRPDLVSKCFKAVPQTESKQSQPQQALHHASQVQQRKRQLQIFIGD